MVVNSEDYANGALVDADLCIVGAGAAGITLAREFVNSHTTVLLLEGGSFESDSESQSLYTSIRNVGRDYPVLYGSRLRYFGGSTNHWGGHCVPLRAINFERLPWSSYSGWPISLTELHPYYRRAEVVLGLDGTDCDPAIVAGRLRQRLLPFDPGRVLTQISRYNRVRFGQAFRKELVDATNIKVMLRANVVSIEAHEDGRRVDGVAVRTLGDRNFRVRAKVFVLATGGIENARILLASRSVHRQGLGNEHDLVGRFFMEHIWYPSGVILAPREQTAFRLYTQEIAAGRIAYRAHLCLPETVVRDGGIPDFRAELKETHSWDHNDAVSSAKALRDSVARLDWPDGMARHLGNIIRDPADVISAATGGRAPTLYLLNNNFEQAPNPASRVALSAATDELGMPIATIDWRLSDIDKQGIRYAHACIAKEVGRSGFGRMFVELPEKEREPLMGADGACHHMGTTRMHDNPRLGVVDRNCRVHGLANLFVAGSSVFPTSGFANPTFTITALAARLGDHIKDDLRNGG